MKKHGNPIPHHVLWCRLSINLVMMAVAAMLSHAVPAQSVLRAWGNNGSGQLGDGTTLYRYSPTWTQQPGTLGLLHNVVAVAGGGSQSIALQADGTVWTWGINSGDSFNTRPIMAAQVPGPWREGFIANVTAIASGHRHTVAASATMGIVTWGSNAYGQFGNGTTQGFDYSPLQISFGGVTQLACGSNHTLALASDRTVWAWGHNQYGQVGKGTMDNIAFPYAQPSPVQVLGPDAEGVLTDVVALAGGGYHSVALKSDGTVWAWGRNNSGQLGDGTMDSAAPFGKALPVQVKGPGGVGFLTGIVAVAAGNGHTLALKSDGTVWTWGRNDAYQLGDGTTTFRRTPVQVKGPNGIGFLTGITSIAGGELHSCARRSDGTVWTWGYNSEGQLGDGTTTKRNVPVQVKSQDGLSFLTDAVSVAAGYRHTLVVTSNQRVWTWGQNTEGQLGDNTQTQRITPVPVNGPGEIALFTDVEAVSGGASHAMTLKSDGTVWAWGNNYYGQLGDGTRTDRLERGQVVGPNGVGFLTDVSAIASSNAHSVALKSDGTVWIWGTFIDGTSTTYTTPRQVPGPNGVGFFTDVAAIAVGNGHTLAIKSDGTLWAWGTNAGYELGDGTAISRYTPAQVKGPNGVGFLTGIWAIAANSSNSIALKSDGTVWTWGNNYYGQLGDGTKTNRSTPVQVKGPGVFGFLTGVRAVATRGDAMFAIKENGTLWTWGYPAQNTSAVQVNAPSNLIAVSAGAEHILLLKDNGTVWALGSNRFGQLGSERREDFYSPVQTFGLTHAARISAGHLSSFALEAQGVIQGRVLFEDAACYQRTVRFEFRPVAGGAPFTRQKTIGPNGEFSFFDIPEGTYHVAVKASNTLQRVTPVTTIGGVNVLNLGVTLPAGDASDDNSVDVLDLDALIRAFNSQSGDLNWDRDADFNGDGSIDALDLDILIRNFDRAGDP